VLGVQKSIYSLLIAPIQRIPRYAMMLQEVLQCTPQGSTEYDRLLRAHASLMSAIGLQLYFITFLGLFVCVPLSLSQLSQHLTSSLSLSQPHISFPLCVCAFGGFFWSFFCILPFTAFCRRVGETEKVPTGFNGHPERGTQTLSASVRDIDAWPRTGLGARSGDRGEVTYTCETRSAEGWPTFPLQRSGARH
jgi:RhoGEF domain